MEKCHRENTFVELYALLGDKQAQDDFREKHKNTYHCRWLKLKPDACEALPAADGIDPDKVGTVCPYNVYSKHPDIFANRDGVMDTLDRLFRLYNASQLGVLSESELDPLSITELIATKQELDRQQSDRMERERSKARMEAEAAKNRGFKR